MSIKVRTSNIGVYSSYPSYSNNIFIPRSGKYGNISSPDGRADAESSTSSISEFVMLTKGMPIMGYLESINRDYEWHPEIGEIWINNKEELDSDVGIKQVIALNGRNVDIEAILNKTLGSLESRKAEVFISSEKNKLNGVTLQLGRDGTHENMLMISKRSDRYNYKRVLDTPLDRMKNIRSEFLLSLDKELIYKRAYSLESNNNEYYLALA